MPNREASDGHLLALLEQRLFFLLEALASEAQEHQHDPNVDDVATVAPFRAGDEADERGHDVSAGRAAAHLRAAHELLTDRHHDERAEGEADAAAPHPHSE